MKGEQLNGLVVCSAKYFFNIDEYTVGQFLLFLALVIRTFRQQLKEDMSELKRMIAGKRRKAEEPQVCWQ